MIRAGHGAVALGALLALSACRKESKPPSEKPAASAAPRASTPRPERRAPVNMESIPTEEDFELDAVRDITSQNLEAELDRLEKELEAP